MTPEARNALDLSIKHWEENVEAAKNKNFEAFKLGPEECALCKEFQSTCDGCPVKESTGYGGCISTPYGQVCALREALGDVMFICGDTENVWVQLQKAAEKELEFLKGLR